MRDVAMGSIFSMRQLAFFGFFFGPIGLGLALLLTLRTLGLPKLGKRLALLGVAVLILEAVVASFVLVNAIYFHLAGAILAKLCYDKWVMRPATAYKAKGGRDGEILQTLFLSLILSAIFYGLIYLVFLMP